VLEKTFTLLYVKKDEVEPVCREKLTAYIKGVDEKTMKSVKDFFLEAITNFKVKYPAEFETADLESLLPAPA
jgi:hypothetical protein